MQSDSHFYVVYVLGRWAGLDHSKSYKMAYASQYVDDAVLNKTIRFDDNTIFKPECTAHKIIDSNQLSSVDNTENLIPFHFFPKDSTGIVYPLGLCDNLKSIVYNEPIPDGVDPYIYLGILLHVIADSYSHQEFYGFRCDKNSVTIHNTGIKGKWEYIKQKLKLMASRSLPIGHAAVLTYPDIPGAKYSYNRDGVNFLVDNEEKYLRAYLNMFEVIRYFLSDKIKEKILYKKDAEYARILLSISLEELSEKVTSEEYRCFKWKEFILGDFNQKIEYDNNIWINNALTRTKSSFLEKIISKVLFDYEEYKYKECLLSFIESDWYKFHICAKKYKELFIKYNPYF